MEEEDARTGYGGDGGGGGGSHTAAIVAGVILGLVFCGLAVGLVFFVRWLQGANAIAAEQADAQQGRAAFSNPLYRPSLASVPAPGNVDVPGPAAGYLASVDPVAESDGYLDVGGLYADVDYSAVSPGRRNPAPGVTGGSGGRRAEGQATVTAETSFARHSYAPGSPFGIGNGAANTRGGIGIGIDTPGYDMPTMPGTGNGGRYALFTCPPLFVKWGQRIDFAVRLAAMPGHA